MVITLTSGEEPRTKQDNNISANEAVSVGWSQKDRGSDATAAANGTVVLQQAAAPPPTAAAQSATPAVAASTARSDEVRAQTASVVSDAATTDRETGRRRPAENGDEHVLGQFRHRPDAGRVASGAAAAPAVA